VANHSLPGSMTRAALLHHLLRYMLLAPAHPKVRHLS
jgi:hypothetical protein